MDKRNAVPSSSTVSFLPAYHRQGNRDAPRNLHPRLRDLPDDGACLNGAILWGASLVHLAARSPRMQECRHDPTHNEPLVSPTGRRAVCAARFFDGGHRADSL